MGALSVRIAGEPFAHLCYHFVLTYRLYPPPAASLDDRPLPDFAELHAQLKRKGVTLALLWEEYKTWVSWSDIPL
ncbi:MAG: hypothetical protein ACREXX_02640 [Gammaproteobacteria bacterium]